MANLLARAVVRRAGRHARGRGWLDVRYGFALLRSPAVPVGRKALALAIGLAFTLGLAALEFPLEGLIALLLPFLGLGFDVAIDGFELVILPVVFGAVVLTWLEPAPRPA